MRRLHSGSVAWTIRRSRQLFFGPRYELSISVFWILLSLAMTRAEIIVKTQKLFFVTNEEVAMPVSYSGAAINYRVKNYSGDVVL